LNGVELLPIKGLSKLLHEPSICRYLAVLSQNMLDENGQNLGGAKSLVVDVLFKLCETFRAIMKLSCICDDSSVVRAVNELNAEGSKNTGNYLEPIDNSF
jgi:hypothetical protein